MERGRAQDVGTQNGALVHSHFFHSSSLRCLDSLIVGQLCEIQLFGHDLERNTTVYLQYIQSRPRSRTIIFLYISKTFVSNELEIKNVYAVVQYLVENK